MQNTCCDWTLLVRAWLAAGPAAKATTLNWLAKATKTKPPTSAVGRDLNLTKNFRSTYTPVARTHFWVAKIRERSYLRAAAAPAALRLISFKQCQLVQNSAQSTHFVP
jgi:hypothetical protein